ncbi:MAG: sulfite exporter TauE/SafE family protein [Bacteroidales bacterium]|nr:sulfite exporter TauE/SafE family protein [Bacteroidales bacterium]
MSINEIVILIAIGVIAGFISGSLGVGGGIIIVPGLIFFLGLTQHQAQGVSLGMMLAPIGLLAFINYYKAGYINIKYSLLLLAVFFVGSYLGSLMAVQLPAATLKKIFGVLMLVAGARMIFWP